MMKEFLFLLFFCNIVRDPLNSVRKLRVNIEDFTLKNLIGKGYFGEVHLAFENVTRDVYAIKKIPKTSFVHSKEERNILAINRCDWIPTLQYAFQVSLFLFFFLYLFAKHQIYARKVEMLTIVCIFFRIV